MNRALIRRARVVAVMLLLAGRAVMAQQPLPEINLEESMRLDAGSGVGASQRCQPVTEAPLSVSFIPADAI